MTIRREKENSTNHITCYNLLAYLNIYYFIAYRDTDNTDNTHTTIIIIISALSLYIYLICIYDDDTNPYMILFTFGMNKL